MKLVITESQLRALVNEQAKPKLTAATPTLTANPTSSYTSAPTMNTAAGTINPTKGSSKGGIDWHTIAPIAQIATSILIPPPGGLIIAAAIGVADAYQYHAEKNDKMAGVTLLLAALPGMTKLAGKIPGLNTLGAKGMALLSDKLAKGITTLAPEEAAVINYIKNNTTLIQQEYAAFVNGASKKIASNVASFGSAKAADAAYEFAYDNPTFAKRLAFGTIALTAPGSAAFALNTLGNVSTGSSQIAANGVKANSTKKI